MCANVLIVDERKPDTLTLSPKERANVRARRLGYRSVRSAVGGLLSVDPGENSARRVLDSIYQGLRTVSSMKRASKVLGVPLDYWTTDSLTEFERMSKEGLK